MNARELDKIIVEIVREMQPISSENVWFEITENSPNQTTPSLQDVQERLQRMKKNKTVKIMQANRGKERYILVSK